MVYSTKRFVVCLFMCHFVLVFFSPFSTFPLPFFAYNQIKGTFFFILCTDKNIFKIKQGRDRSPLLQKCVALEHYVTLSPNILRHTQLN